jgi:hypothetical protein
MSHHLDNTLVDSIVLEISHGHPLLRLAARTGVWCATKLATDAGGWRQINRAGHPMMWPILMTPRAFYILSVYTLNV